LLRIYFETDDIFAHFAAAGPLPSLELFETAAKLLCQRYSSLDSHDDALSGCNSLGVPLGTAWTLLPSDLQRTLPKKSRARKRAPAKPKAKPKVSGSFAGDRCLAQTGAFKFEAILLREYLFATGDGDYGRAWEALKASLRITSH
jgi:hypothetical protein